MIDDLKTPSTVPCKILLISRNFPPRWGGMERLNWHIANELAARGDVQVIAPEGASTSGLPTNVKVHEVSLSPLSYFLFSAITQALIIARKWRPDIIVAGSGLTAPIAWLAARVAYARAVTYVHGLDLAVPHILYRWFWLPFLRHMDNIIANSHATAKLAEQIGILSDQISIVHPGVDIPEFNYNARARFRNAREFGERPLLLSVGRLTQRKGLIEFVSKSLPTIINAYPDCLLLIVGDVPKHALYAEAVTPEDIRAAAEEAGVAKHLCFLGTRFGSELAEVYQAADVHIFPVKDIPNDPEGFGMVAVEAAAYGLPTVAFAVGGISDAVDSGKSGTMISSGDYTGFAQAVINQLQQKSNCNVGKRCREFARGFAWECFSEALWKQLVEAGTVSLQKNLTSPSTSTIYD